MDAFILGSGSKGNATLVRSGKSAVILDAGVPFHELEARAACIGTDLTGIDGIVLTHAHGDHAAFAEHYSEALEAPLYVTTSTRRGLRLRGRPKLRVFGPDSPFTVGGFEVAPTPIPHDAPQVALVLCHQGHCLGLVTDLGRVPPHLAPALQRCTAVMLESNYQPELLACGPYPPSLQQRICGGRGHLSNAQSAALAKQLGPQLRELVLVHLSEHNNEVPIVLAAHRGALAGRGVRIQVAPAQTPFHFAVPRGREQLSLGLGA